MSLEQIDKTTDLTHELTNIGEATVYTSVGTWKGEVGLGHDWVVVRKAQVRRRNPSNFKSDPDVWVADESQIFPRENVNRIEPSP